MHTCKRDVVVRYDRFSDEILVLSSKRYRLSFVPVFQILFILRADSVKSLPAFGMLTIPRDWVRYPELSTRGKLATMETEERRR